MSIGFAAWCLFAINDDFLNLPMVLLGSILPDCDTRFSLIGKFLPLWLFGVAHRGITHTWYGLIAASILTMAIWNPWAGAAMAIGYYTHLLFDSMTPSGVRWFGRRKRKRPS